MHDTVGGMTLVRTGGTAEAKSIAPAYCRLPSLLYPL